VSAINPFALNESGCETLLDEKCEKCHDGIRNCRKPELLGAQEMAENCENHETRQPGQPRLEPDPQRATHRTALQAVGFVA
jgi:hypothetical protein